MLKLFFIASAFTLALVAWNCHLLTRPTPLADAALSNLSGRFVRGDEASVLFPADYPEQSFWVVDESPSIDGNSALHAWYSVVATRPYDTVWLEARAIVAPPSTLGHASERDSLARVKDIVAVRPLYGRYP
jgi:hypothetical protein